MRHLRALLLPLTGDSSYKLGLSFPTQELFLRLFKLFLSIAVLTAV